MVQVEADFMAPQAAARGGYVDVLDFLQANDCPPNWTACAAAAAGGHLHVLEWLQEMVSTATAGVSGCTM